MCFLPWGKKSQYIRGKTAGSEKGRQDTYVAVDAQTFSVLFLLFLKIFNLLKIIYEIHASYKTVNIQKKTEPKIPMKIPGRYLVDIGKIILKFIWKDKEIRIAKINF